MDTVEIGRIVMITLSLLLFAVIVRLILRNRARSASGPRVAGEDAIGGAAKNPEQFDEPDEDALAEMGELLEAAAESHGLTYEE